jgi:hypothetical protein
MAQSTYTFTIETRRIVSQRRFVLEMLAAVRGRLYVHQMFGEFNKYRDSIKKKHASYASFRTIINDMKRERYINPSGNRVNPFDPSAYVITDRGRQYLETIREDAD